MLTAVSACSVTSKKQYEKYETKGIHKICNEYTNWTKRMVANDKNGKVYFAYTCKDRIVFLSPYNTLIYSRHGKVIGFHTKGVFHFHSPSKGWKNIDTSSVGNIKNMWEGKEDYPDYSTYKAPPSLVSQD